MHGLKEDLRHINGFLHDFAAGIWLATMASFGAGYLFIYGKSTPHRTLHSILTVLFELVQPQLLLFHIPASD
jgi:hypothetical protein